jgi:hypothetical protein
LVERILGKDEVSSSNLDSSSTAVPQAKAWGIFLFSSAFGRKENRMRNAPVEQVAACSRMLRKSGAARRRKKQSKRFL